MSARPPACSQPRRDPPPRGHSGQQLGRCHTNSFREGCLGKEVKRTKAPESSFLGMEALPRAPCPVPRAPYTVHRASMLHLVGRRLHRGSLSHSRLSIASATRCARARVHTCVPRDARFASQGGASQACLSRCMEGGQRVYNCVLYAIHFILN